MQCSEEIQDVQEILELLTGKNSKKSSDKNYEKSSDKNNIKSTDNDVDQPTDKHSEQVAAKHNSKEQKQVQHHLHDERLRYHEQLQNSNRS